MDLMTAFRVLRVLYACTWVQSRTLHVLGLCFTVLDGSFTALVSFWDRPALLL